MCDVLNLRQGIFVDAHEWRGGEKLAVDGENGVARLACKKTQIDGGKNSAGNREEVRREGDLVGCDSDLLEEFSGVSMGEEAVGGEIVGGRHEMGFCGGSFARTTDAALGVGDDAGGEVDDASGDEGLDGENDGGGVAAGIGDEASITNLSAMKLGHTVDGFGLRGGGERGGFIVKFVDGAIGGGVQTPCAAEVDDAHAALQGFGSEFTRGLMGCGEEEDIDVVLGEMLPGEGVQAQIARAAGICKRGVDFSEGNTAAETVYFVDATDEDRRLTGEAGMADEKARKLSACVASDTEDGGLKGASYGGLGHDSQF